MTTAYPVLPVSSIVATPLAFEPPPKSNNKGCLALALLCVSSQICWLVLFLLVLAWAIVMTVLYTTKDTHNTVVQNVDYIGCYPDRVAPIGAAAQMTQSLVMSAPSSTCPSQLSPVAASSVCNAPYALCSNATRCTIEPDGNFASCPCGPLQFGYSVILGGSDVCTAMQNGSVILSTFSYAFTPFLVSKSCFQVRTAACFGAPCTVDANNQTTCRCSMYDVNGTSGMMLAYQANIPDCNDDSFCNTPGMTPHSVIPGTSIMSPDMQSVCGITGATCPS
eukprot:TRINITY_DN5929_c0_g1_i1.p1 TRINITY_DN5929_c0_g1~~TRINITY_DN5929_c0_g1_i1.p1  ORF type:complete len:278 (-),score=23.67 TRINITY_DN5929_c0_g1_i1:366-1199(-)